MLIFCSLLKEKMSLPKQIIILRHVEKDADKKSNKGASKAGLARANYLADFLLGENPFFSRPDIIYCFNKHNEFNRSVQAMMPTIKIGHYPPECVNLEYNNDEEETNKMIASLFSKENSGKVVLICWEHKIIPYIVKSIGKIINTNFKEFKSWNNNPPKDKDQPDNYSLTVVINTTTKELIGINQSNKFSPDESVLHPDKVGVLFKM